MTDAARTQKPSRRMARRLFEQEAYRRILAGEIPETLSEFAAELSAWYATGHPASPPLPTRFSEDAIRAIWHRRHEMVGSEL